MSGVSQLLYSAMQKKCESDIADAVARLTIYFTAPVAIGEHPQHTEEIEKLLDQLAGAEDRLAALKTHFAERLGST